MSCSTKRRAERRRVEERPPDRAQGRGGKSRRPSGLDYLLLFLPPFFWSTNFVIGKSLAGEVPPWTLNTGRFAVSALIVLPLIVYRGGWRVPRKYAFTLIVMSLTGVTAFNSVLYIGLNHTSALNATLVNSTTPLTTAGLAWLLIGERMPRRRLAGIALSFFGVTWIVARGELAALVDLRFSFGDVIVLFATLLWGFYSVMAKRTMAALSPFVVTAITTVLGALFLLPIAFFELSFQPADLARAEIVAAFLYLGALPSFAAFLLWNRSVLLFGPSRAALAYNTLPLHAVWLAAVFLGETLMPYQLFGGLAIMAGVLLGASANPATSEKIP
ncbi:MAG TPA: DMT family transporter [Candidatus Acidoferrales bacterium]|nr:DMT family transporter [Candidatus Acidoferrales bacterium]